MDIDEVFRQIGEFGSHQKKIFFSLCATQIFGSFHMIHMVFIGAQPNFKCVTDKGRSDVCPADGARCDKYEYSSNFTSIVSEWDLVCEDAYKSDLVQSAFMAGVLLGAVIFGSLSDTYGRIKNFYLTLSCLTFFSFLGTFATSYTMYLILRVIAGVFSGGMILVQFVLLSELMGSSVRAWCGSFTGLCFAVGIMVFSLLAYLIRDWRHLSAVTSLTGLFGIGFIWLLYESPRWLLSQGRVSEAEDVLTAIAKRNNSPPKKGIMLKAPSNGNSEKSPGIADIFSHPVLRRRTLIQIYAWFVNSATYYGLTMSAGNLGSNMYISVALSGLVEFPANTTITFLLDRYGRRLPFVGCMLAGGIACLGICFTPTESMSTITTLALLGKLAITASFTTAYIYSAELNPTVVRNNAMGVCSMAARFGGIIAPLINTWGSNTITNGQFIVFGFLATTASFLCLSLPETLNQPMPETLADLDKTSFQGGHLVDMSALSEDKVKLLESDIMKQEMSGKIMDV